MPVFLRILALAAVLTVVQLVSSTDSGAIASFEPGGFVCFEDYESQPLCDGDPSPGASSDIRLRFCIGWDDLCASQDAPVTDSAPALVAGFIPIGFTPVRGIDLPIGTIAGRALVEETYGILSNPCHIHVAPTLTMLNATIDTASEIDASDAVALFLDSDGDGLQGGVDRYPSFLNQILNSTPPRARYVGLTLVRGLVYMVNALVLDPGTSIRTNTGTLSFEPSLGYPVVFVEGDPTAEPIPYALSDYCAPFSAELLLFGSAIDNPCTPSPVPGAACPGGPTPVLENRGYPLLPCETGNAYDEDGDGAINDGCPQVHAISEADIPGACANSVSDDSEDSDVNDGCPQVGPLSEAERLFGACSAGDEGGCALLYNPSQPGAYSVTAFSVGYRDADGDGIENPLDVCALIPNAGWDPRASDPVNDPDSDGLPNECDPEPSRRSPQVGCHPAGLTGPDEDLDCYSNRQDNCPLVTQLPNPAELPSPSNPPYQDDADADGIGDACDPNPQTPDGERPAACLSMPLVVGVGAGTTPQPLIKDFSGFDCVGSFTLFSQDPDIDGDGICTEGIDPGQSGCTGVDNCPSVPNPSQEDSDNDGVGDACENQSPIAVGGIAGLTHDTLPPSASSGGSSAALPLAAAVAATGALALSGGVWLALRGKRRPT